MTQAAENLVEEVLARLQRRHEQDATVGCQCAQSEHQRRLIDALHQSTTGDVRNMCGWTMQHLSTQQVDKNRTQHDLSGIISISGKIRATIVVSLDKELAFCIAESMLGTRPTKIDGEVVDLVGELTNMICGNAKERLNTEGLVLGLPTVISGSNVTVAFESGLEKARLNFESVNGSLSILLGVRV